MKRMFARAFAIGFLISFTGWTLATAADVRIRKHVDDMTAQEWSALDTAIAMLHKLDKFDSAGKAVFPQGVDSYERFVQIHGDFRENGACLHGSEDVWFWHRAFLLHFENRLRATNPPASSNITLPYWDWTELASGSGGFPSAYERIGSSLLHARLDHHQTATSASPLAVARDTTTQQAADYLATLLKLDDWGDFGGTIQGPTGLKGALESGTHDGIHGSYIGLDNVSAKLAVRDPIFWAHHANLDRLVDSWQTLHPSRPHCLECDSLAYDRDGEAGPLTVRQVVSNQSIGGVQIVYQARVGIAVAASPGPTASFSVVQEKVELTSIYRFALPVVHNELAFIIPNIRVKSESFYRGDVYLFPADVEFTPDRSFKERYRVAVIGTFSDAHGDDAPYSGIRGANEIRTNVNLADAVRKLPSTEVGKAYKVVVQFVSTGGGASTLSNKSSPDVSHGPPTLVADGPTGRQNISVESIGGAK